MKDQGKNRAMNDLYESLPLTWPETQIRLLRMLPGPGNNDFQLRVHDVDPRSGSLPDYVAISYTWGEPERKLPIKVNGHVLNVTLNCFYALW